MHKRLVALPGRQAAEHRRGGGREMVSISWVEGRTGGAARTPGVAASREVREGVKNINCAQHTHFLVPLSHIQMQPCKCTYSNHEGSQGHTRSPMRYRT